MACLNTLKLEIKTLERIFPKNHERFRILNASVDELTCRFVGKNGKTYDIHANITVSRLCFVCIWVHLSLSVCSVIDLIWLASPAKVRISISFRPVCFSITVHKYAIKCVCTRSEVTHKLGALFVTVHIEAPARVMQGAQHEEAAPHTHHTALRKRPHMRECSRSDCFALAYDECERCCCCCCCCMMRVVVREFYARCVNTRARRRTYVGCMCVSVVTCICLL